MPETSTKRENVAEKPLESEDRKSIVPLISLAEGKQDARRRYVKPAGQLLFAS